MVGLNLLVGKRDADLPLACHSALFRNRPRVAYLKCLTAGAPRYEMHGNVSGTVSEAEAAYATVKLAKGRAQLAEFRAAGKAKKGSEAVAAV